MRLVHGEVRERVTATYPQNNGNNPQRHDARDKATDVAEFNGDGGCESKESGPDCSNENKGHSVSIRW